MLTKISILICLLVNNRLRIWVNVFIFNKILVIGDFRKCLARTFKMTRQTSLKVACCSDAIPWDHVALLQSMMSVQDEENVSVNGFLIGNLYRVNPVFRNRLLRWPCTGWAVKWWNNGVCFLRSCRFILHNFRRLSLFSVHVEDYSNGYCLFVSNCTWSSWCCSCNILGLYSRVQFKSLSCKINVV